MDKLGDGRLALCQSHQAPRHADENKKGLTTFNKFDSVTTFVVLDVGLKAIICPPKYEIIIVKYVSHQNA